MSPKNTRSASTPAASTSAVSTAATSTPATSTPPTFAVVKKGGHAERTTSVRGPRIYGEEGDEPTKFNDPRESHAKHVEKRAKKETEGRHDFRYLCYMPGCAWGTNSGRAEVNPHFRSGCHPGKVYNVKKVITVAWDEWLDDTDLLVTAKATSTEDWYRRFDAMLSGVKEEDVEDVVEDKDKEMGKQADGNAMEIEQEDCKQEDD